MLTAQQLITYALQIVKAPGYTTQASDFLNARLSTLARRYDFDVLRKAAVINVLTGQQSYPLPVDYLRGKEVYYYIGGLPQTISQIALSDYNSVNVGNLAMSYPTQWASDPSTTPPTLYLYPMPNTSFPLTVNYWSQPADIANPATSSQVPWVPDSNYLLTALCADLSMLTNDDRQVQFAQEAEGMLRAMLKSQGDKEGYAQTVKLGGRFRGHGHLPPSKITGF